MIVIFFNRNFERFLANLSFARVLENFKEIRALNPQK